jgi:hypothetical protein
MCEECRKPAKCICFECMANDMFCFIYIGHGFGKGHGFLHGTDLKVRFFERTKKSDIKMSNTCFYSGCRRLM